MHSHAGAWEREKILNSPVKNIWSLLANESIMPAIDKVFPAQIFSCPDINEALGLLASKQTIGKVVFSADWN
ncbi:MAG TPA: hypothetical protein VIM85_06895, partial [Pseudomonadales bacterium]